MSWPVSSPRVRLGIIGKERYQYWKLFFWSLFRRPRLFPLAITLAIYGFHFRKVFRSTKKRSVRALSGSQEVSLHLRR